MNNEKQFIALMKALGREDVLSDPRFADWFLRNENEPALRKIIEDVLATKEPEGVGEDPRRRGRALRQHLEDRGGHRPSADRIPQGAMQKVDTPYGPLRFAGSGFQLAHGGGKLDRMAPALSEHTDEVLASLGYDAKAIAELRAREVV